MDQEVLDSFESLAFYREQLSKNEKSGSYQNSGP